MMRRNSAHRACAIIGIGNLLMGDEGVGVHVIRQLETQPLPEGVTCLDGGTGGLHLLEHFRAADRVILVDATLDGHPPGTVRRLQPRFSSDYPRTLTAHDIGLKDLLDALYLLGDPPEITLYAVSIGAVPELGLELSPEVERCVRSLANDVFADATGTASSQGSDLMDRPGE